MPVGATAAAPQHGFLELLAPLMDGAYGRLRQAVRETYKPSRPPPFDPDEVCALLVGKLPGQLLYMVTPALTLELRIAGLEGHLEGNTPQERFDSFVRSLRRPSVRRQIFSRYPLLARAAEIRLKQWRESRLEMLERLTGDWPRLRRLFGSGDPGRLTAVAGDLSDRHDDGRAVQVLEFSTAWRVVYKPRPLAGESRFQELLVWLNKEGGLDPPLPTVKSLDRGDYGWMEYVPPSPCPSEAAAHRFYRRQGSYLALLFGLEANDFHYENVIAHGEYPVLVDVETIFQPRYANRDRTTDPLADTVLRTHLLPGTGPSAGGLEVGGLSAPRGQAVRLEGVEGAGTDRMQLVRRQALTEGSDNLPTFEGRELRSWDYEGAILDGFEYTYRTLMSHRDALLADGSPLTRLGEGEARVLLRPTAVYNSLIRAACHPDVLRDVAARNRLFAQLRTGLEAEPGLQEAVTLELDSLCRWDIPRFRYSPRTTGLRDGCGREVDGLFARTGLESVRRRLESMDERDLQRQKYLIVESLRIGRPGAAENSKPPGSAPASAPAPPVRYLGQALAVGRQLSVWAGGEGADLHWLYSSEKRMRRTGADLYAGLAGIALFLNYLSALSEEEAMTSLADQACDALLTQIEREPPSGLIGAFTGRGGIVYALTCLGLTRDQPELLDRAQDLASRLREDIASDRSFDLMGGAAGAILCLRALHRHRPAPQLVETAVQCGEHLVGSAVAVTGRGWGWPPPPGVSEVPLTGLSHGTAGISWALRELAAWSGEQRFAEAADRALEYERSWFSAEAGNWRDLRMEPETFSVAWCHGAPGIGLARLATLGRRSEEAEAEIRSSLDATRLGGFGRSHCLCHGDLGNLELWHQAARQTDEPALQAEGSRLAARILRDVERNGPRCGAGNTGARPPGLLQGLSGIGYGLLRAGFRREVPSVLTLETPEAALPLRRRETLWVADERSQ